jgi:hypothetical protein
MLCTEAVRELIVAARGKVTRTVQLLLHHLLNFTQYLSEQPRVTYLTFFKFLHRRYASGTRAGKVASLGSSNLNALINDADFFSANPTFSLIPLVLDAYTSQE